MKLRYPKVDDIVHVDCPDFKGLVRVTYVNTLDLYKEYYLPIQVEILDYKDLEQFDSMNHGQTMRRYGLKDFVEYRKAEVPAEEKTIEEDNKLKTNISNQRGKLIMTNQVENTLSVPTFEAPQMPTMAMPQGNMPTTPQIPQELEAMMPQGNVAVATPPVEAPEPVAPVVSEIVEPNAPLAEDPVLATISKKASTKQVLSRLEKEMEKISKKLKDGEIAFVMNTNELVESVSSISTYVDTKGTIETNKCIHFLLKDNQLELRAANSTTHARLVVPNSKDNALFGSTSNFFKFVIQSKQFVAALTNLRNRKSQAEYVAFKITEGTLNVLVGSSKFNLPLYASPEDFQEFKEVEAEKKLVVTGLVLNTLISSTLYAVATIESRPVLTGVNLDVKGDRITAVATDSHRLARCVLDAESTKGEIDENVTVPSFAMKSIQKAIGDEDLVEIGLTPNRIQFTNGNFSMISVVLEGKYPTVDRLVPKTHTSKVEISVGKLRGALDLAKTFVDSSSDKTVLLTIIPDKKQIRVEMPKGTAGENEYKEDFLLTEGEGEPLIVRSNFVYLNEAFKKYSDDDVVSAKFSGGLRPFIFTYKGAIDDDDVDLVLPVRLENVKFSGTIEGFQAEVTNTFGFDFDSFN